MELSKELVNDWYEKGKWMRLKERIRLLDINIIDFLVDHYINGDEKEKAMLAQMEEQFDVDWDQEKSCDCDEECSAEIGQALGLRSPQLSGTIPPRGIARTISELPNEEQADTNTSSGDEQAPESELPNEEQADTNTSSGDEQAPESEF